MAKLMKVSDILSDDSNLRDIVVTLPGNIKKPLDINKYGTSNR